MGNSYVAKGTKARFLAGVLNHVTDRQLETVAILSDVDQMMQLMTGLLEAQTGEIVSFDRAFADL